MKLTFENAKKYLDKMAGSTDTYTFTVTPQGRLFVEKGIKVEAFEFCMVANGQFLWREGFDTGGNLEIPSDGLRICCFNGGKILVPMHDGTCEYASAKKAITPGVSLLISACVGNSRVILVADGAFSAQPFLLMLTDTTANRVFAEALLQKVSGGVIVDEEEGMHGETEQE